MKTSIRQPLLMFTILCLANAFATAASTPYVVTDDDANLNGATFYSIGAGGALTLVGQVPTNFSGVTGGYFGLNRITVLNNGSGGCVYISDAGSSDVAGIVVQTMTLAGNTLGSATDTGFSNGIGLAANSQYLYASFTDSSTIGTFTIQAGCGLTFVNDVTVGGLQGGIIDGMAVHGNMMIATYGDGSIESFDLTTGTPVSNGDKQNSTDSVTGASYPNGIDITQDGHFAIFGDTSTSSVIEVSDISSGKLAATAVYSFPTSISSSNVLLSPDETYLYIGDTQGDGVTAAPFNKATGKVSAGCTSGRLKGYSTGWSYGSGLALQSTTGNGGGVYIAEFGAPSSIGIVNLAVNGSSCTLTEAAGSPAADTNSSGLLSIGNYPPRSF